MNEVLERFPSSSSDAVHEVKESGDGNVWCTCMGWKTSRKSPKQCSHMARLVANGVLRSDFVRSGSATPVATPVAAVVTAKPTTTPRLLLAESWKGQPLEGWHLSEKLDGVRALWNGTKFVSRGGIVYNAPEWFTKDFPAVALDGELWMGRGKFQLLTGAVRRNTPVDSQWMEIRYLVFDMPLLDLPFEDRVAEITRIASMSPYIEAVPQVRCEDGAMLARYMDAVIAGGGEGLMARKPGSRYEGRRSSTLLKIKRMMDAEALVYGHQAGEGRIDGLMGALLCRFPNGVEFRCGTGFSDAQRAAPPAIGSTVTIRYQELSEAGVPRFPAFVGIRDYE